jgi:hypothetical protein
MRRSLAALLVGSVVALSLVGCGQGSELARGIVLIMNETPPIQVSGFMLRTNTGRILTFKIGPLQLDAGSFNAAHLKVHQVTGQPIIVEYRTVNGERIAFRLTDANVVSP